MLACVHCSGHRCVQYWQLPPVRKDGDTLPHSSETTEAKLKIMSRVFAARFEEAMAEMQRVAADREKLVEALQRFDMTEVNRPIRNLQSRHRMFLLHSVFGATTV